MPNTTPPPDTSAPPAGQPFITIGDLCKRYGVARRTINSWMQRSQGGGIYDKPGRRTPTPAGYTAGDPDTGRGGHPWWHLAQIAAWDEWRANMVGSGVGGGRPRKDAEQAR